MEDFEPLLKFFFWVVFIYLAFRLSAKYLAPYLLKRFLRKTQAKFFDQNPHLNKEDETQDEGEVSIKSNAQSQQGNKNELGEFVEFEEISEPKEHTSHDK